MEDPARLPRKLGLVIATLVQWIAKSRIGPTGVSVVVSVAPVNKFPLVRFRFRRRMAGKPVRRNSNGFRRANLRNVKWIAKSRIGPTGVSVVASVAPGNKLPLGRF